MFDPYEACQVRRLICLLKAVIRRKNEVAVVYTVCIDEMLNTQANAITRMLSMIFKRETIKHLDRSWES